MEVTTDVRSLGKTQVLITNSGPDVLYVGEVGQDTDTWYPLAVDDSVALDSHNNEVGVVSDGVSEVGVLYGGTGIFPPAVEVSVYGQPQPIVVVSGTTHTVTSEEAGSLYRCTSASAVTITVPKDVTDDVADGIYYDVQQVGAGQVEVVLESGAVFEKPSELNAKTREQYSRLALQKTTANTWSIWGDLEPA